LGENIDTIQKADTFYEEICLEVNATKYLCAWPETKISNKVLL
jgi:hypothetical protein